MRVFERRGGRTTRRAADVHANRIDALWRISTGWADGEAVPVDAILAEAAAVVRPGQPVAAQLCRVDGSDLLVEAAVGAYFPDERAARDFGAAGTRRELAHTPYAEAIGLGRTRVWNDRSLLVSPFTVARTQYALAFVSPQPLERPFEREDETFVEIVAAHLERTLQGALQAERLRFQMQHDALTGLVNRSQFRVLLHEALARHERCGLAIVDLVDLGDVNERFGYMIGDALLVEVGATLATRNRGGEFTGRLYGDSFGIAFPGIASRAALRERLTAYTEIFGTPFGTGDRAGRERVALAAQLGCAFAPDDGRTADALLARAAAELIAGKVD